MKKMFMAVIALMMTISASAQFYIYYSDGTVAKVDSISMVAPGGTNTPDTPIEPEEPTTPSTGIGVFSVAEGKTVTFSPGNLQYTQSTDTWSFAENQYDLIGAGNLTTLGNFADKIDLFCYGTGDAPTKISLSTDDYLYFVDWGTNVIGTDTANTWRTLTYQEWSHLIWGRHALLNIPAEVNGVGGLVLFPDNWVWPDNIHINDNIYNESGCDYSSQTFTKDEWLILEQAGAVFLPAAGAHGYGGGLDQRRFGDECGGFYWVAPDDPNATINEVCYTIMFSSHAINYSWSATVNGYSVRLVKDL